MAKFDYEHAKEEIAKINQIVETCPDAVKEKCFELLFAAVFGSLQRVPPAPAAPPATPKEPEKPADPAAQAPQTKKLPSNVMVFTRKYNVTNEELGKLFMLDHEPLLSIYNLPRGNQAQAQLYKVLLI